LKSAQLNQVQVPEFLVLSKAHANVALHKLWLSALFANHTRAIVITTAKEISKVPVKKRVRRASQVRCGLDQVVFAAHCITDRLERTVVVLPSGGIHSLVGHSIEEVKQTQRTRRTEQDPRGAVTRHKTVLLQGHSK
jgi:hypothetical protein